MFVCVKKKFLTCIHCEHKPFWQLSWLDDFTINATANCFAYEILNIPKAYSSWTSKMELFARIVNG